MRNRRYAIAEDCAALTFATAQTRLRETKLSASYSFSSAFILSARNILSTD